MTSISRIYEYMYSYRGARHAEHDELMCKIKPGRTAAAPVEIKKTITTN